MKVSLFNLFTKLKMDLNRIRLIVCSCAHWIVHRDLSRQSCNLLFDIYIYQQITIISHYSINYHQSHLKLFHPKVQGTQSISVGFKQFYFSKFWCKYHLIRLAQSVLILFNEYAEQLQYTLYRISNNMFVWSLFQSWIQIDTRQEICHFQMVNFIIRTLYAEYRSLWSGCLMRNKKLVNISLRFDHYSCSLL